MPVPNAIQAESQRACAKELLGLGGSHRREVMAQLSFDRIAQKQEFLIDKFHTTDNWNETAYLMLLRSLDIKENRSSYERLAKVLPYRYFAKVGYERRSIEALLLGSAGLLPRLAEVFESEKEVAELQAIYDYDAHKFALEQMSMSDWQLTGHIGDNHPVIRLLQLASVLSQHEHLLNDILSCRTRSDVEKLFCSSSVPRWAYRFLSEDNRTGAITRTKAQMLGINVVAQLQIFYSEYTMRSDLDSRGIELLEQLPAESNLFMNRWQKLGIKAENALESQALLQLTKEYCTHLRCDKCLLRRFIDSE
ncbi:MAG: DUF2851 family protein [Alistipes sp.]|nr:DUF2851 family protein [Alistipes sp.]